MRLGVVIPAFNARVALGAQLSALQRQREVSDIVVADNGSSDSTADVARVCGVRVVDASARRGAAFARNVGVRALDADVIAFCDADDVVSETWAAAIVGAVNSGASLVGGPLRIAGAVQEPPRLHGSPFPAVPTANIAVTRKAFDAVNGFDERYRTAEDTDFCWRVQQRGFRFTYQPDMVVDYELRCSLRASARQRYVHGWSDVLLIKNFDLTEERHVISLGTLASAIVRLPLLALSARARSNWINWWAYVTGRVVGSITHRHLAV